MAILIKGAIVDGGLGTWATAECLGCLEVTGRNPLGSKGRKGSKIRMKVTCKFKIKQNK